MNNKTLVKLVFIPFASLTLFTASNNPTKAEPLDSILADVDCSVSINPIDRFYPGETQQYCAETTCDGEIVDGIYSWTVTGGTLDTTSGDCIMFAAEIIDYSICVTDIKYEVSDCLSFSTFHPWIDVSPDPMYRSRWIMIPVLVTVATDDTSFDSSTVITYEPPTSVLPMPPLVVDVENIWQLIFIMPSWLTGIWDESETLTLAVTWEAGAIYADVTVHMLPFPLDEQKILK